MRLTPILIPGKRKRETSKAAVEARKALKRPPGRPLKLTLHDAGPWRSLTTSSSTKQPKKRTLKTMKPRRKMSNIEKLPTELLERVFLYCLNLNLPRSSPILAGRLSSQMVYSQTLISVFGPTWNEWREEIQENGAWIGNSPPNCELQSAVLRCRWASLSLILKSKDIWIQTHGSERVFQPIYFMKSALQHSLPDRITATEYFNADFYTFTACITQPEEYSHCNDIDWSCNHDVASAVQIPQSLLSGPWTEEKIRHLYWMRKSGAQIDWLGSTSGEIAFEGLRDAIREGDLRVIHLLEWSGLKDQINIDILIFAMRHAGGNRISVIRHFMEMVKDSMYGVGARKFRTELSDMKEEAVLAQDKEGLILASAISDLKASMGL